MTPTVEHCPACGVILSDKKGQRSHRSHGHFFARVNEAWDNFPDKLRARHPSPEHLRKWALIRSGFCDQQTYVFDSDRDAQTFAVAMKKKDEFAVVIVKESVVDEFTAKSQSLQAMGKADFQASKDAVFAVISEILGADIAKEAA